MPAKTPHGQNGNLSMNGAARPTPQAGLIYQCLTCNKHHSLHNEGKRIIKKVIACKPVPTERYRAGFTGGDTHTERGIMPSAARTLDQDVDLEPQIIFLFSYHREEVKGSSHISLNNFLERKLKKPSTVSERDWRRMVGEAANRMIERSIIQRMDGGWALNERYQLPERRKNNKRSKKQSYIDDRHYHGRPKRDRRRLVVVPSSIT